MRVYVPIIRHSTSINPLSLRVFQVVMGKAGVKLLHNALPPPLHHIDLPLI
jgi:hypothetical protein